MAHDGGIDRFLPWRKVQDITGLGRTTAWRLRRAGDFPHPVPISPGRVAWRERDIAHWNETRGSAAAPTYPPPHATRPPRPTPRPPESQTLDPAPANPRPAPPLSEHSHATSRPSSRRPRRGIVEGQLGFDF